MRNTDLNRKKSPREKPGHKWGMLLKAGNPKGHAGAAEGAARAYVLSSLH